MWIDLFNSEERTTDREKGSGTDVVWKLFVDRETEIVDIKGYKYKTVIREGGW